MLTKINLLRIRQERLSLILLALWLLFYFSSLYRVNDIVFNRSLGNQIINMMLLALFAGFISSILLLLRIYIKFQLLVVWYCFIVLIRINTSLFELHLPILALLCLTFALSPSREEPSTHEQQLASMNSHTLLGIVCFNYTLSGLSKLIFFLKISPEARTVLMPTMYQRPEMGIHVFEIFQYFSSELYLIMTILETICFFLFIKKSFRKYAWLAGVVLQLTILVTCQLGQISLLFLIAHIYTFDIDWLKSDKTQNVSSSKTTLF